jgi:hypothetical protein
METTEQIKSINKSKRCKCRNITNNNICKNRIKFPYYIDNKICCVFHYKYYRECYAITIQSYYRGYKQRKIINNLYKKFPDDIQRKIILNMRQDFYYKKYVNTIRKIVCKKIYASSLPVFIEYLINLDTREPSIINNTIFYLSNNYENIINDYKLYIKYYSIIENNISYYIHNFYKYLNGACYELKYSNYQNLFNIVCELKYNIENLLNININSES